MKIWIYFFTFLSIQANAQSNIDEIHLKLKKIAHMPYICVGWFEMGKFGCGDSLFWQVVTQKDTVILDLIALLDDTTLSQVYFPNYGGLMTVADIAKITLGEIIQPLPEPDNFTKIEKMNGSQWMANIHWLQINHGNRVAYKNSIQSWYIKNNPNLFWNLSDNFMCGDIVGKHPNKGHFELKKL